ncbi:MAG: type II toxin-antitoxin system RelE/ParE family toxin [Holosporales bacterium]
MLAVPKPKRKLVFSDRARRDLQNIKEYTVAHWGHEQAATYIRQLYKKAVHTAAAPLIGKAVTHLNSQQKVRSISCGLHTIYYTFTDKENIIVRILHQSMDAPAHL